jgi:uncharacterized protein involved in response to NO
MSPQRSTSSSFDSPSTFQHAPFRIDYIWAALAIAIFIGFAIGAHLSFVIGFAFQLGDGFYAFIQTHGHAQLMGWSGLFIIGVSLHFIPRLAGAPIARPQRLRYILWLIAGGILFRSVGHSVLPYVTESSVFVPLLWLVALSGVMELSGVILYLMTLLDTIKRGGDHSRVAPQQRPTQRSPFSGDLAKRPALISVKPFFMMMFTGWLLYAIIHAALLVHMALMKFVAVDQAWNEFSVHVFIGLILLPAAFAFSVRTFPLYLRLPAPDWPVRIAALVYLIFLCIQLAPTIPPLAKKFSEISLWLSSNSAVLKGCFMLWFIWKLDILTRWRKPWTVNRIGEPQPDRRPTRPGLPDYGEFGSFEKLLYSAYVWLAVAAIFEIISGASVIFGFECLQSNDAPRHMIFLGFISLLILGMAVRMIPGFLGKKKIASAKLVGATFWLGNGAAVCRVLPIILPEALFEVAPAVTRISQAAFALSGILGMAAVGCLALNLRKTAQLVQ